MQLREEKRPYLVTDIGRAGPFLSSGYLLAGTYGGTGRANVRCLIKRQADAMKDRLFRGRSRRIRASAGAVWSRPRRTRCRRTIRRADRLARPTRVTRGARDRGPGTRRQTPLAVRVARRPIAPAPGASIA